MTAKHKLFLALEKQLQASSYASGTAEAHGLASGLSVRQISAEKLLLTAQLLRLDDDASRGMIESLMEMSSRDFSTSNFQFDLWLPESENTLEKTQALAQWCEGFIIGLCHDGEAILKKLSADSREAFADIQDISGLVVDSEEDAAELAFFEVKEYVRMATQLMFEELNPKRAMTDPETQ